MNKLAPLHGVTVVEMGTVVLAPYASRMLQEMGATVIKVEAPGGDITRKQGPSRHAGMAALFMSCNRGKQSVCIDLKQPEGVDMLLRLLDRADVFLTNLRPRNAQGLGINHERVLARNPRLIYCAAYGFGEGGRYRGRPAYDDIIQAMSGYASLYARIDGTPRYSPSIMADKTSALFLVQGVLAALFQRQSTGEGQFVEVPMFETMVHYLNVEHQAGYVFEPNVGPSGYLRMVSPQRKPHRTKDGFIAVMPHNQKDWVTFFNETGNGHLMADPKFASDENRSKNINALYDCLVEIMPTRTNAEWFEFLSQHQIPHAPIMDFEALYEDPHLTDVGFWQHATHPTEGDIRWPKFPVNFHAGEAAPPADFAAPCLGEHTKAWARELGYSEQELADLLAKRVVSA